MNKMESLKDLFIEQGRELNDAYEQELDALPRIEKEAASPALKKIIGEHIETTKTQQARLVNALTEFNVSPNGNKNAITKVILKEANRRMKRSNNSEICDACIVNSLQQLGHRKIADLGALTAYAKEIGEEKAADMLHASFEEEKQVGRELINLAQAEINRSAVAEVID